MEFIVRSLVELKLQVEELRRRTEQLAAAGCGVVYGEWLLSALSWGSLRVAVGPATLRPDGAGRRPEGRVAPVRGAEVREGIEARGSAAAQCGAGAAGDDHGGDRAGGDRGGAAGDSGEPAEGGGDVGDWGADALPEAPGVQILGGTPETVEAAGTGVNLAQWTNRSYMIPLAEVCMS